MDNVNLKVQKLDKPITNPELVEAIKELKKDFNPETQNKVLNIALNSVFLVPGTVNKTTKLVADEENHVHFDESPEVKFLLINHSTRGNFIPAFTDDEQISTFKANNPFQAFALRFVDLAALTENTPTINGFVVNPTGDNLPFPQTLLDEIKKTLIKAAKEKAEKRNNAAETEKEE